MLFALLLYGLWAILYGSWAVRFRGITDPFIYCIIGDESLKYFLPLLALYFSLAFFLSFGNSEFA